MSTTSLPFTTLDVFTTEKYAGNPLAIVHVPHGTILSQAQKQTIAREFNLSETAFLHLPASSTSLDSSLDNHSQQQDIVQGNDIPIYPLDIFTTEEQLPFAGHPTIGTAIHILRDLRLGTTRPLSSSSPTVCPPSTISKAAFLLKVGRLDIEYDGATDIVKAQVPCEVRIHGAKMPMDEVMALQPALARFLAADNSSLQRGEEKVEGARGDMAQGNTMETIPIVSLVRGMTFAIVALPSLEALAEVRTMGRRIQAKRDEGWDTGPLFLLFYVRMPQPSSSSLPPSSPSTAGFPSPAQEAKIHVRTRMIEGTFEDPATGSASIALASLLALSSDEKEHREDGRTEVEVVQGVEMGRRSEMGVVVDVEGGRVKGVELRGGAVRVMEGRVEV